jgi:hypothetical protein
VRSFREPGVEALRGQLHPADLGVDRLHKEPRLSDLDGLRALVVEEGTVGEQQPPDQVVQAETEILSTPLRSFAPSELTWAVVAILASGDANISLIKGADAEP